MEIILNLAPRCLDLRRQCEGYQTLTYSDASFRSYRPKQSSQPTSESPKPVLVPTATERRDVRQLLAFYQDQVSQHLAGFVDTDFWSVQIPQLGQSEPSVAYAIAAISATFQTIRSPADSSHGVLRDTVFSDPMSLEFYNLALKKTTQRVVQHDGGLMATLTCMLFLCLEFLQSNKQKSKILFSKLCELVQFSRQQEWARSRDHDLTSNLQSMHSRIVLLSLLFVHPVPGHYYQDWTPHSIDLPQAFMSLHQARDELYQLMAVTHDFCKLARTNSEAPNQHSVTSTIGPKEQAYLISKLCEWRELFRQWCTNKPVKDAASLQSIALLRLYDHISMGWLMNPWEYSQLPFDGAREYFELAVEECSRILAASSPNSELMSIFHFEMGILPPLYFTAIKCRAQRLRMRAFDLLRRAPRREGLWDREELVAVAGRVIEIETAAVSSSDASIPDFNRVYDVGIEQHDKGSELSATFSFRSNGVTDAARQIRECWTWDSSHGKFVLQS
jgi:hypothetical protein